MNLFATWLMLTVLTLFTRIAPLFAGKWLSKQRWIEPLSTQLPCMILVLLVLHDVEGRLAVSHNLVWPVIFGLGSTTLCYRFSKQIILSIFIGVAVYFLI